MSLFINSHEKLGCDTMANSLLSRGVATNVFKVLLPIPLLSAS